MCVVTLAVLVAAPALSVAQAADSGLEKLDFRMVVKDAKDKVFPAVVFIKCLQESRGWVAAEVTT